MIHRTFLCAALVLAFLAAGPAMAAPAVEAPAEGGPCFGTVVQGWVDALVDQVARLVPGRAGRAGGGSTAEIDPDGTTELRPALIGLDGEPAELRPALIGYGASGR